MKNQVEITVDAMSEAFDKYKAFSCTPKTKILLSEEEYEDLKELLDYGYYYIARSKNDTLCAYEEYPRKNEHDACWSDDISVSPLGNDHFKFIKWEDEEPTSIEILLAEYESAMSTIIKKEQFQQINLTEV